MTMKKKDFRKFFKFPVNNPISVRTEIHTVQQDLILSAQIRNVIKTPLFLESVKFDPVALFKLVDLVVGDSTTTPKVTPKQVFGSDVVYLKGGEIRQYLFKLEPKNPQDPKTKNATVVGKLDIVWKNNMGENGRLQTALLERKIPQAANVEIKLKDIPQKIVLETPFEVTCEIINRAESAINPKLEFLHHAVGGILAFGLSGQVFGQISSGGSLSIKLSLFPSKPGVQKITGIRITDTLSEKNFDFYDIIDVFVELEHF